MPDIKELAVADLSADGQRMLTWMETEYVRCGFMYSGAVGPGQCPTMAQLDNDSDRVIAAFDELEAAGIVERRKSIAWTYALDPERRVELIDQHDLAGPNGVWQREAPYFYPNDPSFGEIPRARAEAASK